MGDNDGEDERDSAEDTPEDTYEDTPEDTYEDTYELPMEVTHSLQCFFIYMLFPPQRQSIPSGSAWILYYIFLVKRQ